MGDEMEGSASGSTSEFVLKSQQKKENLEKEFEAKRRQSRQLDQQLEEKRRKLKAMDSRLKGSKRDLLSYSSTPKQSSSIQKRKSKEKEIDDDDNSSDLLSEDEMNMNISGNISDDDDDTSTDIEELPSLDPKHKSRQSHTNLFFSSLNGNSSPRGSENSDNPRNWSIEEVGEWLRKCGLGQYVQDFGTLEVDGTFLLSPQVNKRFLTNVVHVKADHIQKLIEHIQTLKN